MKQRRVIIIAVGILFLVLSVSVWSNIRNSSRHDYAKGVVLNQIYANVKDTIHALDSIIDHQEWDSQPFDRYSLEKAAIHLTNVDSLVRQNGYYFEQALHHPGILSFDFIADTLISGGSVTNGIAIHGILKDDVITEDEVRYMSILRDDLESIAGQMVGEDGLNANEDLTIAGVNAILNTFYSKWSRFGEDDCPYLLLREAS